MVVLQRLGVEPVGMAGIDGVFTEHVEVPTPKLSGVDEKLDSVELVPERQVRRSDLEKRIERVLVPSASLETAPDLPLIGSAPAAVIWEPAVAPEPFFADLDSMIVEVGDLVFIRYDESTGTHRHRASEQHDEQRKRGYCSC